MGKVIIFSAPSGAGKTTIVRHLLEMFPQLNFSISATTRTPRGQEENGKDYYFLSKEAFEKGIQQGAFVEYEEVYAGTYYGTLKSEVQRIWDAGNVVVFDVDVVGGVNLKKLYGEQALSIFIQAPSVEALAERLRGRGTDTEESVQKRIAKATEEMSYAPQFDHRLINDDLAKAFKEAEELVQAFISTAKI